MNIPLLDSCTTSPTFDLGVSGAGVLGDLAQDVLDVDQLHRPPPQAIEFHAVTLELLALAIEEPPNRVLGRIITKGLEALRQTIKGARSGNDEAGLIILHQRGVIEVDGVLERQECAEGRIGEEQVIRLLQ